MKLFFVGDTHNEIDLDKLNRENLNHLHITDQDILIHLGDIGVPLWNTTEDRAFTYFKSLPFEIIVCLGNHENYAWIKKQPIVTKYSALGYQLAENMFAPLLGEIVKINDTSLWFYPGGYSIDYYDRIWNQSIFVEELPTLEDSQKAIERLIDHEGVDIIVSHDGPREFIWTQFGYPIAPQTQRYTELSESKEVRVHPAFQLDQIYKNEQKLYKQWYFGHHHLDYCYKNVCCVFDTIHRVDLGEENA